MFENIHFKNLKLDIPITQHNYQCSIVHYFEESELILATSKGLVDGEFVIDGSAKYCIPYAVSDYAKSHLFYITQFAVSDNRKNYFTRRKKMDSYLLSITYEGEGVLEYEGLKRIVLPGSCFLIDCEKPHFYRTNKDTWKHADLHFQGGFTQKIIEEFNANGEYILPWAEYGDQQRILEEMIHLYDTLLPYRELLISNQLENLLITLLKASSTWHRLYKGIPENLQDVLRYMEIHYMDHLTLDFLSNFSGINKYSLIRSFNRYIGTSPKEYIIRLQIEAAKKLLKETTLPANKIGAIVGLENENYFRHLFKERTKMTPGEYRKSE